jgi:trans-aconitate methyltransferase
MAWDAAGYDDRFSFVTRYGSAIVDLLDPQPGERVVDLGCGTAHLTAEIAARGALVEGVDADLAMVERAHREHPDIRVRLGDARTFAVEQPVDAVFSNATLHWVPCKDQEQVAARVRAALRPGGRFVAEMGGAGNVAVLLDAVHRARAGVGLPRAADPWCFPTVSEQADRLERAGFDVRLVEHFARPSRLADGDSAADWLLMFGRDLLSDVPDGQRTTVLSEVDRLAAPDLRDPDGAWTMDYVRLRFWAVAA